MSEPKQKPGKSEQTVCTPDDFLAAFKLRFGPITWDLAATPENSVAGMAFHYGPESIHGEDAFEQCWEHRTGNLWLNPPFGDIAPWAAKAFGSGALVNLLVPLSSANWARDWVWGNAMVYPLNPRLVFKGHAASYPKDMMLVRYGTGEVGCSLWRWK